jgi:hypothetical protein
MRHALTPTSSQWEAIDKILRRRVFEKEERDPIAMELVGTEPAPLLKVHMYDVKDAIDVLTNGVADVSFCGYVSILCMRYILTICYVF